MTDTTAPASPGYLSEEIVQSMIDQALSRQAKSYEDQVASLTAQLSTAQEAAKAPVLTRVPEHAGGIGHEIRKTWSLMEQELSRLGRHPDQVKASA